MATQGNQPLLSGKPVFEGEEKPLTGEETEEEEEEKKPEKGKENGHKTPKPEMDDIEEPESGKPAPDIWYSPEPEGRESSEDFLEENKELIKKVNNILTLIYPDSGVTIAELLESSSGYLSGYAGSGGTGSGGDGSGGGGTGSGGDGSGGGGTGTGGDGSGGGETGTGTVDDEERTAPKYSIYIDDQSAPIEQGRYEPSSSNYHRSLVEFIGKKSLEFFWADNEKLRFNEHHVKKCSNGNWIFRTVRFKFENVEEYMVPKLQDREEIDFLSDSMLIMYVFSNCDIISDDYTNESKKYKFTFGVNGQGYTDDSIRHAFTQARAERSRISNAISSDTVNEENMANYLNAVCRESNKRIEEIKRAAKGEKDKRRYVFDVLAESFFYDETALQNNYQMVNNMPTALATNSSMCKGMAAAFSRIMNELGIEIGYVSSAKNDHAWNFETVVDNNQVEGFWYDLAFQVSHPDAPNPPRKYYGFKNDLRYVYKEVDGKKIRTPYIIDGQIHNENDEKDDLETYKVYEGLLKKTNLEIDWFDVKVFKRGKKPFGHRITME